MAYSYTPESKAPLLAANSDADELATTFEIVRSKKTMKQRKKLAPANVSAACQVDKVIDDAPQ